MCFDDCVILIFAVLIRFSFGLRVLMWVWYSDVAFLWFCLFYYGLVSFG